MLVYRYSAKPQVVSSSLDIVDDLLTWLGFVCSRDYLSKVLREAHGYSAAEAAQRAKSIVPYVRVALGFIEQSRRGPSLLSYLPSYYAILNLMKVYILAGPHHGLLAVNASHGVIARPRRVAQSLMTDVVTIKKKGAMSLFYQTLTGEALTRDVELRVKDFLPLVARVGAEYKIATGEESHLIGFDAGVQQEPDGRVRPVFSIVYPAAFNVHRSHLKILDGYTAKPGVPGVFLGPPMPQSPDAPWARLRRHLIYRLTPNGSITGYSSKRVHLPEEMPIALLFFYLSTVVRYRADFLARLSDSREWPIVAAARSHALTSFLLCFWSYLHKTDFYLE